MQFPDYGAEQGQPADETLRRGKAANGLALAALPARALERKHAKAAKAAKAAKEFASAEERSNDAPAAGGHKKPMTQRSRKAVYSGFRSDRPD